MKKYICILLISLIMSYSVGCGHAQNKEAMDNEPPSVTEQPEPLEFSSEYYKREVTSPDNCYYIDSNNTLWGYGYNYYNQLGDYDKNNIYIPSEEYKDKIRKNDISEYVTKTIKIADNVKHISYTGFGSLAYITDDNKLYGLGCSFAGNLMNPPIYEPPALFGEPIKCPKLLLEDVLYAEITDFNMIALKTEGSVWIWGGNLYGEYGSIPDKEENYSLEPIKIMDDAILVAGSGENFAVIKRDSSLWAWGNNYDGIIDERNEGKVLVEPEDMYCIEPQKIMDNIKNGWFGISDRYTIYVQKKDGTI